MYIDSLTGEKRYQYQISLKIKMHETYTPEEFVVFSDTA